MLARAHRDRFLRTERVFAAAESQSTDNARLRVHQAPSHLKDRVNLAAQIVFHVQDQQLTALNVLLDSLSIHQHTHAQQILNVLMVKIH